MRGFAGLVVALCMAPLATGAAVANGRQDVAFTSADVRPAAPAALEARRGELALRVDAITPEILRVRLAPGGHWPEDASWAVSAAMRASRAEGIRIFPDRRGFDTGVLSVRLDPATLALTVTDRAGRTVVRDIDQAAELSGPRFTLRKAMVPGEGFYALGDKTAGLNRRGHAFVNWTHDVGHFDEATDPLYKAIPFYIAAGGEGGAYGLFLDNSWRSWFDFGRREPDTLSIGSEGGPIDYYLIAGPTMADVVQRYTTLTGRAPLPPLWAFGNQQSRWSYMSSDEVTGVVDRFRAERFPLDVIWLDIDYQDRYRPFTTNPKTFPDFPGLVRRLRDQGVRTVAITDLHIADTPGEDYRPFVTGQAGDHFIKNADGSLFTGHVWPERSVFPDFSRAETRRWFGGLFKDFLDDGLSGFWLDMNEPSVFGLPDQTMPMSVVHRVSGDEFAPRVATHAEIHNVLGMLNTRAGFEGLSRLAPDKRPFLMTRASYAGGQRYAVTWTGDNSSTWAHLKLSLAQVMNLGLSGFSYAAVDVGGFWDGQDPELLTRWIEIGAFMPLLRNHAALGSPHQEPWLDGPEQLAIRRRFVEERYRLLPYIYGLADEASRTGAPLMRPIVYEFPDAPATPCDRSSDFMLGRSILVAPSPRLESHQPYELCPPPGDWYDYWTGSKLMSTGMREGTPVVTITPRADTIPVFVRAGSIIPRQRPVLNTTEMPQGPLQLDIYPGPDCQGVLYTDDGETTAYERGRFFRQRIRCATQGEVLTITFEKPEGVYRPTWRNLLVTVHGVAADRRRARIVGGKQLALQRGANGMSFALDRPQNILTVELR